MMDEVVYRHVETLDSKLHSYGVQLTLDGEPLNRAEVMCSVYESDQVNPDVKYPVLILADDQGVLHVGRTMLNYELLFLKIRHPKLKRDVTLSFSPPVPPRLHLALHSLHIKEP